MSVPNIYIRDDGKGFIVRKGGIDWLIQEDRTFTIWQSASSEGYGEGETIMEAVDAALAKLRAAESLRGDK